MNDLERFLAVCTGETPDYVPIFSFPGAPGMGGGCMKTTHDRLVETGMPPDIGGTWRLGKRLRDLESWYRYWGTTQPVVCDVNPRVGVRGFRETRRIEDGFEIIESESGALTRQVVDNDITYSMPEFVEYPVRDRASWAFYKERMTPADVMSADEIDARCRAFDVRTRPLTIPVGGAYGFLRGLFGPEKLSLTFYDDPELIHDMMSWRLKQVRTFVFPLIERLRPESVYMGEDLCYNHGMLLSPGCFHEFCGEYYQAVCDEAFGAGAALVAIDTDGNLMEFVDVATHYGVNGFFPCEVKAGNDLFRVREKNPDVVLIGWLEKETVNEGNEHLIRPEIESKVPPLLAKGRYFPNGDHGLQPWVTFDNLCRFMTLLHEVTGNPEGTFPRKRV